MTTLYALHLSTHKTGMVKGPVNGETIGISEMPERAAVRECLPHFYRKAFDRAGSFWQNKHDVTKPQHVTLHNSRGKYLNTVYAIPYEA